MQDQNIPSGIVKDSAFERALEANLALQERVNAYEVFAACHTNEPSVSERLWIKLSLLFNRHSANVFMEDDYALMNEWLKWQITKVRTLAIAEEQD